MRGTFERVRNFQARVSKRRAERRATRPERAEKKARAEALRRQHQREDMGSKIHRKQHPRPYLAGGCAGAATVSPRCDLALLLFRSEAKARDARRHGNDSIARRGRLKRMRCARSSPRDIVHGKGHQPVRSPVSEAGPV